MLAIALTFLEAILQGAALVAPLFIRAAAARPEPAGAIKILVVGDSHAAGAGVPKEENLPSQLERLLAQRHPDRTFRVFNLGLPGVNSPWVANRLERNIRAYDPDVVQGTVLDRAEIDRQIELYRTSTADERRHIVGLQPNRAEVILAGACIVRTILARLGRDSLTVSDRGLRHGLLVERFGR